MGRQRTMKSPGRPISLERRPGELNSLCPLFAGTRRFPTVTALPTTPVWSGPPER
jgi:hypothetical protein